MVYNSLGVDKCIKLFSHHHDHDEKQFYYPKCSLALPLCSQPQLRRLELHAHLWKPLIFSVTTALLFFPLIFSLSLELCYFFPECHINGNICLLCLASLIQQNYLRITSAIMCINNCFLVIG